MKQLFASVTKLSLHQTTDRSRPLAPSPPQADLTDREREVLRFLFSGSSTKAVAKKLRINPSTTRNHVNNILAKLGVHSCLEAVTLAFRSDLI